jgi:hypothetical protein
MLDFSFDAATAMIAMDTLRWEWRAEENYAL